MAFPFISLLWPLDEGKEKKKESIVNWRSSYFSLSFLSYDRQWWIPMAKSCSLCAHERIFFQLVGPSTDGSLWLAHKLMKENDSYLRSRYSPGIPFFHLNVHTQEKEWRKISVCTDERKIWDSRKGSLFLSRICRPF